MKYYLLFLLSILLLLPTLVYAQDTTPTPTTASVSPAITSTLQQREENKEARMKNREKNRLMRLQNREDNMASRTAMQENRMENHQNLKALFKQKLATFKDTVKAERVNTIENLLTTVNANRTAEMQKRLDTMSSIITKLETTLSEVGKNGKDITAATQTLTDAKTALDGAKIAVEAQSKKDYTITITSETGVKTDIMTTRQTLFTDLQTLNQQIVAVRTKVIDAIQQTKLLVGDTQDGK